MAYEYILLPLVAFAAYLLKGVTGFGPAIIVVAFGSLIMPPREVIAMSAVLDIMAGAMLLRMDWRRGGHRFWMPLALAIVLGSILGSFFLEVIPPAIFQNLLSAAIFLLGIWFLLARPEKKDGALSETLPRTCSAVDRAITFVGGICGGLFGISGPPIIWYFGRRFAKRAFRQTLIPIFLAAALARTATYASIGILDRLALWYVLLSIPGLLMGILLGNRIFLRLSERGFRRMVGVLLVLVAIQLYLK